jgi:hypothetical protein
MISKMNQRPRGFCLSPSTLSFACFALLTVSSVVAQKRVAPAGQSNSNTTGKSHVATLRSSDTSEGSRVAITSDQSLNNYEAYRRGDRFYVKIPGADVPRAESARGRGFADVKSQRSGDSTVLSFRLEPGASAHVEQRGNNLDVVVSAPGGTPAAATANRAPEVIRPASSENSRRGEANQRGNAKNSNSSAGGNKNGDASKSLLANSASGNARESASGGPTTSSPTNSDSGLANVTAPANATPETGLQSPGSTDVQNRSVAPGQQSSAITNTSAGPSPAVPGTARRDFWARAKERGHYWLLLAQLNPIPVALGAMLVFIVMLLFFLRRRATSSPRIKTFSTRSIAAAEERAASKRTEKPIRAATATVIAKRPSVGTESTSVTRAVQHPAMMRDPAGAATVVSGSEAGRSQPVGRAFEEVKKVLAGDQYDERVIGSGDAGTRRLVGAELMSALVSRTTLRRERARAAFMKHGYFDDATHELRIASSENERAAAARRLSFVNDREATPHLVAALSDPSPDVRRAAVEALMDMRDPAAIPALNTLLQNEQDRKVPQSVIQKAIEACATGAKTAAVPAPDKSPDHLPASPPEDFNADREVIEI